MNKEVIDFFKELPEVKRLKEIEPYIEGSKRIQEKFTALKDLQKQIVNSKEYHLVNQLKNLEEEYTMLYEELLDIPFVEEYLELVDIINQELQEFSTSVEAILAKN